jgi:hypothetical protein
MRRTFPLPKRKGKQPAHNHRGTPSSRPTPFKHSLASSLASNDTTLPGPGLLLLGSWVRFVAAASISFSFSAGTPDKTAKRSAEIQALGAFRGTDAISQSSE